MQPYKGTDEERGKGLNTISWPEHQPSMCAELFFELQTYRSVFTSFSLSTLLGCFRSPRSVWLMSGAGPPTRTSMLLACQVIAPSAIPPPCPAATADIPHETE